MVNAQKSTRYAAAAAIASACIASTTLSAAADAASKFSKHTAGASTIIDHSAWDKLLKNYVVAGKDGLNRVRYKAFKAGGHGQLKSYIKKLEGAGAGTAAQEAVRYLEWLTVREGIEDEQPETSQRKDDRTTRNEKRRRAG